MVKSIAEQRQIFKGADHAFLWKPKLRIPDIYESRENQLAFSEFLDTCSCCTVEKQVLAAIRRLDERRIKGVGPAAANLLYFLHPTIIPPFNTAIVNGYNLLTGAKIKLGSWEEFLAMREGILRLNGSHRSLLSNDLGAIGGLLFEIGSGRYAAPPLEDDDAAREAWEHDLANIRELSAKEQKELQAAREGDRTHTEVQGWLRDLGTELGFDDWIAANDRARPLGAGKLGDGCLADLPPTVGRVDGADSVRLIDVLWLIKGSDKVAAAFEVEHTTSIYSGIVRLLDLASGVSHTADLRMVRRFGGNCHLKPFVPPQGVEDREMNPWLGLPFELMITGTGWRLARVFDWFHNPFSTRAIHRKLLACVIRPFQSPKFALAQSGKSCRGDDCFGKQWQDERGPLLCHAASLGWP